MYINLRVLGAYVNVWILNHFVTYFVVYAVCVHAANQNAKLFLIYLYISSIIMNSLLVNSCFLFRCLDSPSQGEYPSFSLLLK
jgi:hypothetical protein